jgi:spore coat protein H
MSNFFRVCFISQILRFTIIMKKVKYILNSLFLTSAFAVNVSGQVVQSQDYLLNLQAAGLNIENTISMDLSASEYEIIKSVTGEKISVRPDNLIINGDTLKHDDISTRGQTSLNFRRKSLSFKLKSNALFRNGKDTIKLKKFDVLNLSMDKYYIRNALAFRMMQKIEVFDLFYTFCDMRINGRSEGIFMIIEKPEDWAIHKVNSPLVLRRGYDHMIQKVRTDKKVERSEKKKYQSTYREIYKTLDKYEGEDLYNTLSKNIDLDNYMKWLAFNFFVHNGDYSDEVFFYIDPEIQKFRIIPWDYDDIFAIAPHEGKAVRNKIVGDKLIFSSEDLLDVKIARDPYLYNKYLSSLKSILVVLNVNELTEIFEDTYAVLFPYYSDKEIISNSQYDVYKDANPENLKAEMETVYYGLRGMRQSYLEVLDVNRK